MVVSDHSPCTPDLKILDKGDFMEAWGGIASVQLGMYCATHVGSFSSAFNLFNFSRLI